MAKRTPEEIDAMEREVTDYRAEEARTARKAACDQAGPMFAALDDGSVDKVKAGFTAMQALANDTARFPTLGAALNAARVGLDGVRQVLAQLAEPKAPPAE